MSKRKPTHAYATVATKAAQDLAAKKKLLVKAEQTLARAKQAHEELIVEVARLDMLDRALRAVVEGTEPPTNVRYVYNYPQWTYYNSVQLAPNVWTATTNSTGYNTGYTTAGNISSHCSTATAPNFLGTFTTANNVMVDLSTGATSPESSLQLTN